VATGRIVISHAGLKGTFAPDRANGESHLGVQCPDGSRPLATVRWIAHSGPGSERRREPYRFRTHYLGTDRGGTDCPDTDRLRARRLGDPYCPSACRPNSCNQPSSHPSGGRSSKPSGLSTNTILARDITGAVNIARVRTRHW
jgi:hypothetical protein